MPFCGQYHQTLNPFSGLAESIATSASVFFGDAAMVSLSLTTSSGTASRYTLQGYEGTSPLDGFTTAIAAADPSWRDVKAMTNQGYFSLDTIPRWGRFQRTPSNSSSTLYVTIHVGA